MFLLQNGPFEVEIDLGSGVGANLAPFWLQNLNQTRPKTDLQIHFLYVVILAQLGAQDGPKSKRIA